MVVVDIQALRPSAADVELVAGLLAEVGEASAPDLAADLGLTALAVAGVLRQLERDQRVRRTANSWQLTRPLQPTPRRRSWHQGGGHTA
jgi:predicted ArsR family transcriptional regulator